MKPPFSAEEFFQVFVRYNRAVQLAPWLLTALALVIVWVIARKTESRDRIAANGLAFLWLWSGLVYHLGFFSAVTPLANLFALAFVAQGVGFAYAGQRPVRKLVFDPSSRWRTVSGAIIVGYALIGYPALALLFGHSWPAMPTFGAPCPVVICTWGVLMWTGPSLPKQLLIVPIVWTVVGSAATVAFGVREDFGLLVAGLIAGPALLIRAKRATLSDGELSKVSRTNPLR